MEPQEDQLRQDAESLYMEWQRSQHGRNAVPFDRLCALHPRLGLFLRKLHKQHQRLSRLADSTGFASASSIDPEDAEGGTILDSLDDQQQSASDQRCQSIVARMGDRTQAVSKYHLAKEIGQGSMGRVLQVWDEDLRRNVALKLIGDALGRADLAGDEVARRSQVRFVEEAQITAQLDHPNIVPLHDFGITSDGRAFFTMKLVKGRELRHVIDEVHSGSRKWTLTRALGIVLKACEALSYAHDKGVIHRDLKPANIMVGKFGAVYVMDWGLARVHADDSGAVPAADATQIHPLRARGSAQSEDDPFHTQEGQSLGTPFYMSPEQARGDLDLIGPASDVFGMGAILYHLLTGRAPHFDPSRALSVREVLSLASRGVPQSVHRLAPDAPQELRAIVERAMAPEIGDRYASIEQFSGDIIAYIEGRVVGASPRNAMGKARRFAWRHRAAAVFMAAWVGTSIFLWQRSSTAMAAGEPPQGDAATIELVRSLTAEGTDPDAIEKVRSIVEAYDAGTENEAERAQVIEAIRNSLRD